MAEPKSLAVLLSEALEREIGTLPPPDREEIVNIANAENFESEVLAASPPSITDERQDLELGKIRFEIDELKKDGDRKSQIHWARLLGLGFLFLLVVSWLYWILRFVYWSGTPANWEDSATAENQKYILTLPQPVILALIGSTTINVVGLFLVAARWLYTEFPRKKK
jgi:hypothetical protein